MKAINAARRYRHGLGIRNVALNQAGTLGYVLAFPRRKIIQDAHVVAALHQRVCKVRPDESAAAGD